MKKSIAQHLKTKLPENPPARIPVRGCWSWAVGGSGWQFAPENASADAALTALRRALELSVNWIDTAVAYGVGSSKDIVALALTRSDASLPKALAPARTRRAVATTAIHLGDLNLAVGEPATITAGRAH